MEDNTCILDGNIFSKENILVDMSTESNDNIPVEKRWNKYNKMHVVQVTNVGFGERIREWRWALITCASVALVYSRTHLQIGRRRGLLFTGVRTLPALGHRCVR